ncbi:MAG: phosphoglucosamine mutase [Finegoldia sp.]|nr:phosphoglucosamine mutase [Finegoldia sp.]
MGKYFGTDGIRGVVGEDLTNELAYKTARAACYKLKDNENKIILIGKDTRISGDSLEAALTAGITSMGFDVYKLGVIPTPAVAYLTRYHKAAAGIVISASHNPYEFNGIKYFSESGFKLPDDLEESIEHYIDKPDEIDYKIGYEEFGRVKEVSDASDIYIDYLVSRVDLDLSGKKVALDCANGATSDFAPVLFERLKADVKAINTDYDGININENCGSTHPEVISDFVKESKSDMGFSFDGDGDRLIACDEKGNIMDGDHVLCAAGYYLKEKGKLKNDGVVGTVMTNIGLEKALQDAGAKLIKAKVGDRYVLEEMLKNDYIIGGEQSGHIIFIEDNTTGDGMLTAIKLAQITQDSSKKLSELNELMVSYPQVLVNAKVTNSFKKEYVNDEVIKSKIAEVESEFNKEGRVLIRPSGTEPLIRVMIEGKDEKVLAEKANILKDLIEERSK